MIYLALNAVKIENIFFNHKCIGLKMEINLSKTEKR